MRVYERSLKAGLTAVISLFLAGGLSVAGIPSASALAASAQAIRVSAGSTSATSVAQPSFDTQLLVLINRFRIANGRPPLTVLADLSDRATAWSAHLRAVGTLSHDRNLGSQAAAVCSVSAIRENVAFADAATPSRLLTDYLNSPPHRANLLATDVRFLGLGTVTSRSPSDPGASRFWNTMKFVGGRCPVSLGTRTAYSASSTLMSGPATATKGRLIPITIDVRTRTSHGSWVAVYFTSTRTRATTLIATVQTRTTSGAGRAIARFSTYATTTGSYLAIYGGGRVTSASADLGSSSRLAVTVAN